MADETAVGTDRVSETYVAAIRHELVDLDGSERLVGVVRRPTPWFHAAVDENRPALGPPADLLDAFKETHEDLKLQGMCDRGAHNAAWEELDLEDRYLEHLRSDPDAQAALDDLVTAAAGGDRIVLVCYEGDDKRCHRHLLVDEIRSRLR